MLTRFITDYLSNRNHVQDRFGRTPLAVLQEYGVTDQEQQLLRGSIKTLSDHVHAELIERFSEATALKAVAWGVEDEDAKRIELSRGDSKAVTWGVEDEDAKRIELSRGDSKAVTWGVEDEDAKRVMAAAEAKALLWGVEDDGTKRLCAGGDPATLKAAYWGVEEDAKKATVAL